ncbi:MAG: phosphate ABC transporter permease subunit PstC [Candidatus Thermoplasmatota archaeon]|nr:phosphate ABC transporter permease subunit PstC [Candidatus Thermoplasmatota archaeon]
MSLLPVFILVSIFAFVFYYSIPAIRYMGVRFFTTYLWYPGIESRPPIHINGVTAPYASSYGILLFLTGTLISSALAIVIALPLSFLSSMAVELYVPSGIKKFLISMIELFAGIPSVIYGLWGIIVLEPLLFHDIEPWMRDVLSTVPGFAGEIYSGAGILASGVILAFMIIPIIVSVMVNSFDTVPAEIKHGIVTLGATKWELGKYLITDYSRMSTYGGTLLGLGRALGETMAVLMVSGAVVNVLPSSFYSAINTMAAAVASLLDSAFFDATGMSISALSELSLVLMIISLSVNVLGRRIAGRSVLRGEEFD